MHVEFLPYAWGKETVSQSQKMRQINGQYGRVLNTQLSKENLKPDTQLGMSRDQYLETELFGLSFYTSARVTEVQSTQSFHLPACQ